MNDLQQRIHDLLARRTVAALATVTEDGKPWVRYMVPRVDDELTLTCAAHLDSRKVAHLRRQPEVHLTCGVAALETARQYVQVQGRAEVVTDARSRHAFWNDWLRRYFTGPDDPKYCLIVIRPYRIEYLASDLDAPLVWTPA